MSQTYTSLEKTTVEDLLQELVLNVDTITSSRNYREYLKLVTHFPTYSVHNLLLIFEQYPQATYVAGYSTWKSFGRHVKKGAKGIRILAPYVKTEEVVDEATQVMTRKTSTSFRRISVFDVSQTEGRPLPSMVKPKTLKGDCEIFADAKERLETATGYSIQLRHFDYDATGECSYVNRTIYIEETSGQRQKFKTMIHECAHALLHERIKTRPPADEFEKLLATKQAMREMEAESVSYIVCTRLGIDCSEYSFQYIASWKRKEQFLGQSLKRITNISLTIIQLLDDLASPVTAKNNRPVQAGLSSDDISHHPQKLPDKSQSEQIPAIPYGVNPSLIPASVQTGLMIADPISSTDFA